MSHLRSGSPLARLLCVFVALMMAFSATAQGWVGIGGLIVGHQSRGWRFPKYSHAPVRPNLGSNPFRDENRETLWTPEKRAGLAEGLLRRRISRGWEGLYATTIAAAMVLDGNELGGDGQPGEGSNSGTSSAGQGSAGASSGGFGGQANTSTGNKLTSIPIIAWPGRGDSYVSFTLYHNGRGNDNDFSSSATVGWSHSYDVSVLSDTSENNVSVQWGDGTMVPFLRDTGTPTNYRAQAGFHDKLVRTTAGWQLTTPHQILYTFNASGWLTGITFRSGDQVTLAYTGSKLSSVTDSTGRALTFGGQTRMETITAPANRVWTLDHEGTNTIQTIELPGGKGEYAFDYDTAVNMTRLVDPAGGVWTFGYDSTERLIWEETPSGDRTQYEYETGKTTIRTPLHTAQDPHEIEHNYSSGLLASVVDEENHSVSYYDYTPNREAERIVDQRGKTWYYDYDQTTGDGRGNLLFATTPNTSGRDNADYKTTFTYTAKNDIASITDPLGNVTTYQYDASNRLEKIVQAVEGTTTRDVVRILSYDSYRQPTQIADSANGTTNRVTQIGYGTHGDITSIDDPAGVTTSLTYDGLGRRTELKVENDVLASYEYDDLLRLIKVQYPGASAPYVQISRDAVGRVTQVRNELGQLDKFFYDASGRLIERRNGKNDIETYEWKWTRLDSMTNGRGKVTSFTYTKRGEPMDMYLPDGQMQLWSYNGDGSLYAMGYTVTDYEWYRRDDAGRAVALYEYDTDLDVPEYTYQYDYAGRMTAVDGESGTTTYAYDKEGKVTQMAAPQGTISYGYDLAGRMTSMTEPGNRTTTYAYDASNGRLNSFTNPESQQTSFTYDSLGRVQRKTMGAAGLYEQYGYDARWRVSAITVRNVSDDAVRRALGYAYDDASRIAQFTATGADATAYAYDAAGQLVGETRGTYSASYGYDGNGNRTFRTVNGVTETYAYDDGDKLQSISDGTNVRTFAYDDRGRRTEERLNGSLKRTYAWDRDDRLAGIEHSNPPGTPFAGAYGPDGARVGKTDSGGTRTFLRSGPGVTAPVLSDGAATYTPGVSEVRSGVSTFTTGGLKNQDAQWSSAGALMATRTYDAFGNVLSSTGTWSGPFGYGGAYGYQEDASGLKLLGHRYYDPSTGSFVTRDPIKDGRNWYAYCDADPVTLVDEDGWSPHDADGRKARVRNHTGRGLQLRFDFMEGPTRVVYDLVLPPGMETTSLIDPDYVYDPVRKQWCKLYGPNLLHSGLYDVSMDGKRLRVDSSLASDVARFLPWMEDWGPTRMGGPAPRPWPGIRVPQPRAFQPIGHEALKPKAR